MLELLEMLLGLCPLCGYFYVAYRYEEEYYKNRELLDSDLYEEHLQELELELEEHKELQNDVNSLDEAVERKCFNHEAPFAQEE